MTRCNACGWALDYFNTGTDYAEHKPVHFCDAFSKIQMSLTLRGYHKLFIFAEMRIC